MAKRKPFPNYTIDEPSSKNTLWTATCWISGTIIVISIGAALIHASGMTFGMDALTKFF